MAFDSLLLESPALQCDRGVPGDDGGYGVSRFDPGDRGRIAAQSGRLSAADLAVVSCDCARRLESGWSRPGAATGRAGGVCQRATLLRVGQPVCGTSRGDAICPYPDPFDARSAVGRRFECASDRASCGERMSIRGARFT